MPLTKIEMETMEHIQEMCRNQISLRDYFAGKALSVVSDCSISAFSEETYKRYAEFCYKMADAMLEARKK